MKRGFTVVELIIVIAIAAILLAAILPLFVGDNSSGEERTSVQAVQSFAAINYPGVDVVSAQCQDWDTDGNGYVSCTLGLQVPGQPLPVIQALECPRWLSWNDQCRVAVGQGRRW